MSYRDNMKLIEAAAAAVKNASAHIFDGREAVPLHSPSELCAMSTAEQDEALRQEEEAYRARPELAALYFCLSSSIQLLDVGRSILEQPLDSSTLEEQSRYLRRVDGAKAAGRAAYRAALILSETTAD